MITVDNLRDALEFMGFIEFHENIYLKHFSEFDCNIEVNFNDSSIYYPESSGLVVNDRTTCNFGHPENFVVLECVNRLLVKGYRPEHIELEKRWNLGHLPKGGKSDICVKDETGENVLFIVECKTYGQKYNEELNNLKSDGGQLFSYWQQERSCKWLALYASDYVHSEIIYSSCAINCQDDPNLVLLSEKDDTIALFKDAQSTARLYQVWRDTYLQKLWEPLIFNDDSVAYQIGVKPLRKKDLKILDNNNKLSKKFQEILRHNNVSDKENAFNCLIALFICKLVDEICSEDQDVVKFQYKQGTDDFESLQDRLQQLHQKGMKEFMQESVFYVPSDYAKNLFSNYNGSRRIQAIEELNNTIRILKFYTNNDFSFKNVHNEELFLQNGKILVEVVQLFENYKIVYPSKQQFLGNLFENLLSDGFRQDEGQYFTPTPITRFIWECLPLKSFVAKNNHFPKIIDYACGAGHFLTEGIDAINYIFSPKDNKWVRDSIFGIEKDYRLTRVAKIALFMNGAGDGNIVFGDGLDNSPARGIENEGFDILVANPPYAVEGFKPHLKLKDNSLTLLDYITDKSSEIETLFVERINQLLKPKGYAAVVLPSTILTNDTSYIGARELLLEHFYIHGIVTLGEKTFGATPTSTVILFLEKFASPPQRNKILLDTVNTILSLDFSDGWNDADMLKKYVSYIGLSDDEYVKLISGEIFFESLNNISEYCQMYIKSFSSNKTFKKWLSNNKTKKLSDIERNKIITLKFREYVHLIEKEKMYYFFLVSEQKTIVITCPTDNSAKQDFLGFKWTKKDKSLKLEYLNEGGALYNPINRFSNDRLSHIIRCKYSNEDWVHSDISDLYVKEIPTVDMIDFSGLKFTKQINVSADIKISFTSNHPKKFLSSLLDDIGGQWIDEGDNLIKVKVIRGTNFTKDGHSNYSEVPVINVLKDKFDKRQLLKGDIVIEKSGGSARQAVGRVLYFDLDDTDYTCSNFTTRLRLKNTMKNDVLPKYIFIILNQIYLKGYTFGYQTGKSNLKNLNLTRYLGTLIPIPKKTEQQKIISEWEKIDIYFRSHRMEISEFADKIDVMLKSYDIVLD